MKQRYSPAREERNHLILSSLSRNLDVSKNAQPNEHSAFIFRLTLQSRLRKGINTKIAVRTKVTHWSETDFLVDILG